MAYTTTSIASRIQWCRRQSTQAFVPLEIAEWCAEADGLQDALLHRDHTAEYQQGSPSVFERYALGLQDGQAVLRTAAVHQHVAPPIPQAGTGRTAGMNGMDNVNMPGLTRHVKKIMGRVSSHRG